MRWFEVKFHLFGFNIFVCNKSSLQYHEWVFCLLLHLLHNVLFFQERAASPTDWHAPFSLPSLDRASLRFGNLDWVSSKLFAPSKTWAAAIHVQPCPQQVQIWSWGTIWEILTTVDIANIWRGLLEYLRLGGSQSQYEEQPSHPLIKDCQRNVLLINNFFGRNKQN